MRFCAHVAAFVLLLFCLANSITAFADPSPLPSLSAPIAVAIAPSGPSASPVVAVAEPAAPPAWAQDVMVAAQKLPVIGPVLSKALLYLGILSSILTLLAGFVSGSASALKVALDYAGLDKMVAAIESFKSGKIMYWLKFFSMFNAKKAEPKA